MALIPGRTKCSICGKTIEAVSQSARLPYIDPAAHPGLLSLAQGFVHRHCWNQWDKADTYSRAAYELVIGAPRQEVGPQIKLTRDRFVIFWIEASKRYNLVDFRLLVTLEIARTEVSKVIDFLGGALEHRTSSRQETIGHHVWTHGPHESGVRVTISDREEMLMDFVIPEQRYNVWKSGLDELRQELNIVG
jgi:hypothetical protein